MAAATWMSYMPSGDEKLSKRFVPFHPGDIACTRGVFENGTKNGDTVVMILHETPTPRIFAVIVLDVRNKAYRTHLQERDGREQMPHFRICKNAGELQHFRAGDQAIDPVASWLTVADAGEDIDFGLLPWMPLEAKRKKSACDIMAMDLVHMRTTSLEWPHGLSPFAGIVVTPNSWTDARCIELTLEYNLIRA